jgi:F0F1-type ATP synthase assembly protein I
MVKLTKNRAKVLGVGLVVLGVAAILAFLWLIFWGLSFLITGYVSTALFVILVYLSLRKL